MTSVAAARPGLAPGVVIVDHSTVSPVPTVARFAHLRSLGFTYISAPVFMGPEQAECGAGHPFGCFCVFLTTRVSWASFALSARTLIFYLLCISHSRRDR